MLNGLKLLIARKKSFQNFFDRLHEFAIYGMNFSNIDFKNSGETLVLKSLAKDTKINDVFFDVGANEGHYSNLILEIIPNAKIYAFEPSKFTYNKLVNNAKGVNCYSFGMSDKIETKQLNVDNLGSTCSSLYEGVFRGTLKEDVQLSTIDSFCEENKIGKIKLLKIDTEGHELAVLKGATAMLSKGAIENIQFEMGHNYIDSRTFLRDFFELLQSKYRIFRIVKDGLFEIKEYNSRHEIFVSINYLAILR
jgi:FkbM family methyltransferase